MSANLLLSGLLAIYLFARYLQNRSDLYLDSFQGLFAFEGLAVSVYLSIKLWRTWQRETALKDQEERSKLFSEISEEAVLVRVHDKILDVNQVLADMLGYRPEEMIGKKIFEFMDSASAVLNKEMIDKGYPAARTVIRAKRKDGTVFPLLVHGKDIIYRGQSARLSCGWDFSEVEKMQDAILENETRIKKFADSTREGIFIHDAGAHHGLDNSLIVDANQAFADMVGLSLAEIIGRDPLSFVDEKTAKWLRQIRIGELPTPSSIEVMVQHSNGTWFPVEITRDSIIWNGKPMRIVRLWNLTERKKIENQLLESRERLRKFAECTREGIVIHDMGIEHSVIVDVNQAFADMVGMTTKEVIGRDPLFFVSTEMAARAIQVRKGEVSPSPVLETSIKHANGSWIPVEIARNEIVWNGTTMRMLQIWNLTEGKKIEKALTESQERFERFAAVTREGILIHDKGTIIDFNQALSDMTGYSREELIGRKSDEFIDKASLDLVRKFRIEGYTDHPYEIKVRKKNGELMPVEAHGTGFEFSGKELRVVSLWDITERKKAEEALRHSEEKFRSLIENSHDVISVTVPGSGMTYISPSVKRVLGYEPAERFGRQYGEIIHPDDMARIQGEFEKLVKTPGATWTVEFRMRHKDGSWRYVESTGTNLLNNPAVGGLVYNLRDVTESKKAEDALKKSEESFRNLIEKSPDAIIIHTPNKAVYVNDALLKLIGYSKPEDVVGKFPTFFVHPNDTAAVHHRIDRLKKPGDYNPPQEKRFIRKDGEVLFVDVVSFLIYFEGIPMTVAVARDLTERKKTEEALRQSERNFRNLIEKSPDGVIIHTIGDPPQMVYVNDAMLQFLGYAKPEELMRLKPNEFIREKDIPVIIERIERLKTHGDYNPPQEKVFVRKDGEEVHAEVVSFFIHYEGLPMVAVVVRDLTERKKTEESLIRMERLSTIGEMSAGMAHEIRNPLAAISMAAQMLKRKKPKEDQGQLKTILEQADRLEKLVRETLIFAKPDAVLNMNSISVKAALESALRLSQIQFGPSHQKIKIVWDVPKVDVEVKAELGRLQQIFVNLLLNAYQALGDGGEIILGLRREGSFVKVIVQDNGPGIPNEEINRIFEPFFTTKKTGSGLGLAVSQRIAQEYGGSIEVKKRLPCGSEFIVSLPVSEGE